MERGEVVGFTKSEALQTKMTMDKLMRNVSSGRSNNILQLILKIENETHTHTHEPGGDTRLVHNCKVLCGTSTQGHAI